jgi:hypothetical protein
MKKEIVRERPYEYLRRMDTNEPFSEETVRNWYIARAYVLDKLKAISIAPDSGKHLHAVVGGDSPLMLAVVRQLALTAHYPSFVEYDAYNRLVCRNRTLITLVSRQDAAGILRELEKEENLGHLLKCARYSLFGKVVNEESFLDVTLEVVAERPVGTDFVLLTEEEALAFAAAQPSDQLFTIDTRKAVYASRVYSLGAVIDNLPYEDINSAGRYNRALDTFQYKVLQDKKGLQLISSKWEEDPMAAKNGLSNVICTDCFAFRELAIQQQYPAGRKLGDRERTAIWEKNIQALSLSEHGRWVVEKLVLGFSPLSGQERSEYGSLFGSKRAAYIRQLKSNAAHPVHIDICSYRDLCRIDPDSLKYDSFLMLAIPSILDAIRKADK